MATLHCVTSSTRVEVKEPEAVKDLLEQYTGIPEKTEIEDGQLWIIGYTSFHPRRDGEPDATAEFLHRLQPLLEDELVIQTVGNEKIRFPLVACQFRVHPEDGVFYSDLETDERRVEPPEG